MHPIVSSLHASLSVKRIAFISIALWNLFTFMRQTFHDHKKTLTSHLEFHRLCIPVWCCPHFEKSVSSWDLLWCTAACELKKVQVRNSSTKMHFKKTYGNWIRHWIWLYWLCYLLLTLVRTRTIYFVLYSLYRPDRGKRIPPPKHQSKMD